MSGSASAEPFPLQDRTKQKSRGTESAKRVEEEEGSTAPSRWPERRLGTPKIPRLYPGYIAAGSGPNPPKMAKIVVKNLRRVGAPNVYLPIEIKWTLFCTRDVSKIHDLPKSSFSHVASSNTRTSALDLSVLDRNPSYFQYCIRKIELFRQKDAGC